MQKPEPVLVSERFPALLDALLDLLTGLSDAEWQKPVHGGSWSVKDLAQHLLGDEINILSGRRDGYSQTYVPVTSWDELVAVINQRNGQWVEATRRMSPRLICELLRQTGEQVNQYFQTMDLYAIGGPVNWAGPEPAPVWLDVAREFTERWHHQQHMRDALGKPGATEAYFLGPVLAAFVLGLPVTYQAVDAPEGASITLTITGEAGGVWSVVREGGRWQLYSGKPDQPLAEIELPEAIAWKLFTKGIRPAQAREHALLSGDLRLAEKALETISIIA